MKKQLLKGIAKAAEKAINEAEGSKSSIWFYEADMPKCLKDKKMNK